MAKQKGKSLEDIQKELDMDYIDALSMGNLFKTEEQIKEEQSKKGKEGTSDKLQ